MTGEQTVDEAVRAARTNSRRRQLLAAAVKVMQDTGFHQMSMQALADEADVSVGLIYKYFGGKQEILLATITTILDAFNDQVEPAMLAAGDDPVDQLTTGMRRYMEVVGDNRDGVMLTYRESRTLDHAGRELLKQREVATAQPLRAAIERGIATGVFAPVDADLVVFDIMMLAHAWALKYWHFSERYSLADYIDNQIEVVLRMLRSG